MTGAVLGLTCYNIPPPFFFFFLPLLRADLGLGLPVCFVGIFYTDHWHVDHCVVGNH